MMQSTAIKGDAERERGGGASARPTSSFDPLARDPCFARRKVGTRGRLATRGIEPCRVRRRMADADETFHVPTTESERHARPRIILPLAHTVPRAPVSSPSSPRSAAPLYYHRQAFSSSHHGRRTAMRELLLFVGRRPAQAAGFSMISNPFRCAYARDRVPNRPR